MEKEKIIFCDIAWMKEYKGTTKDDIPRNGGKFVKENNDCCESTNFLDINRQGSGFVEDRGQTVQIEKVDEN